MHFKQSTSFVKCPGITSLAWDSQDLVNAGSGTRIRKDGTVIRGAFSIGYPFDRGLCARSANALWTLAYENRGTKAVLLKDSKMHRELNRSFYFAKVFDYPVALHRLPNDRVVVVHCPNSHTVLECEDAETGERLWTRKSSRMEFHSRLAISENGRFLLSAGWFWHPVGGAWLCPLQENSDATPSEDEGVEFSFGAEIDSAAFLSSDRVVVTSTDEVINEEVPYTGLPPMTIGVWSIPESRWLSKAPLVRPTGTIMPWGDWAIAFYEHPSAIEFATGKVVHVWDSLDSGRQIGSINLGDPPPPQLALNPNNGLFAVGSEEGVTVVNLEIDP